MAGHEWNDWFEREEFIGQISDIRVQNLQVEREVVQKRTFTRWMNLHLEKCHPPLEVHDLFRDIQDGRILMALLEELSGSKLLHAFKPSSHRIFRLNNIAKVLTFLEERNVKLVSIDAADVADGNSSIILGLIWNIILFFQIKELTGNIRTQFPSTSSLSSLPNSSDSDTSHSSTPSDERNPSIAMRDHGRPIKTLLQWVQRRTRKYGVAVQDFGKSWTSGLAFLAVIKSIDSSLVDMRRAILRSSRENLEEAFRTAHYSLGIPRLLEPEDVTINAPDEQSIMTYVSQFLEHFPGFDEDEVPNATERSMSMKKVNGVHGKKEKPFVVGSKWVHSPPKIFISSLSEDKGQPSSPLLTPGLDKSSDSVFSPVDRPQKRPQDLGKEVCFTVSSSSSPQPSFVDSVIDSPDSLSDITSEAVPLEKLVESQSDGSLNENELPFDQRDWPPGKPSNGEQETPEGNGKATEDQVFTDLFIDEGNFSESSVESFQTKPKIPSEEEDAYQYIIGLNEEETAEQSSPGNHHNPDQMTDRLGSVSEQMEETSVAQNKEEPEQTNVLHKYTTLSQNNMREPSLEHSLADDSFSKNDDRLEGALEHGITSASQNHNDDKQSPFSQENVLTDTIDELEGKDHAEISKAEEATNAKNPMEDKDASGLEKTQIHETPSLDITCDPERTMLGSSQPSEMVVNAPDTCPPVEAEVSILVSNDLCEMSPSEENTGAPDNLDETKDDKKNENTTSCALSDDEHRDSGLGSWDPDDRNETQAVTAVPLSHPPLDIIIPEVIETLKDHPPKTPTEEAVPLSPQSPLDPQISPKEWEGTTEECTDDHAYLSWTVGPDHGDDINDAVKEADEESSSTGSESRLVGLHDPSSVLEHKPAPGEGRALGAEAGSKESLVENREHSSQETGWQEGLDASSQKLRSSEHQGKDVRDSSGTELDMPSILIKTDEDPVVASENTVTLRSPGVSAVTTAELYWLLFLWIVLYCFFVLPQMDLKTLPHLLLNLEE